MPERMIETFNTHLMTDAAVRALATGRESELAQILSAIRSSAAAPNSAPQALIVYGERGSGKSFLMRLVQIECAPLENVACVLLPEELYNIRAPQQLLEVVAAHIRGQDWSAMGWRIDTRPEDQAWEEDLQDFHAALDQRFGPGQGLAVVLLENFDTLAGKLFGATLPAGKKISAVALARRQAEERLRKLLGARGGRYMLVASALGTVDMEYERPLFQAFAPVDLAGWSADTAIEYYNKRRRLEGVGELSPAEEGRARAITEFIGGNARLAQLLGTVLSSPNARTIAQTLDLLVDHLSDYYRQRLDSLPPAAAGVLDAMIRGGEPVSQTGLAQRVRGEQRQIADAFSFLARGRLVQAVREKGGASQLYHVRDRLFVHFYRRRYGGKSGLAAIAELLERFFTPDERETMILDHLQRGEFDAAQALVLQDSLLLRKSNFSWTKVLNGIGGQWLHTLANSGRAAAYAQAAEVVPRIKAVAALFPLPEDKAPLTETECNLSDLTGQLLEQCSDPGFLRDMADLLEEHFETAAVEQAALLRQFAALHDAPDKEAFLQYLDPDVASGMRRVLGMPEPEDSLSTRGRKRAR